MNILTEIGTLFKLRTVGEEVLKEAQKMNAAKPGWKTTEFWVKIVTIDLPMIWGVIHSFIPATLAVEVELGATAIYTIARVVSKAVVDIKAAKAGQPVSLTATATVQPAA